MCVCVQPTKRVRCGDGTSAAAAARQSVDRDDDQSRRVSDQLISFFSLGSDAAGGVVGLITFSVGGLMPPFQLVWLLVLLLPYSLQTETTDQWRNLHAQDTVSLLLHIYY